MKAAAYGTTNPTGSGDVQGVEILEDRCSSRRKHGLPARYRKGRFLGKGGFAKCYEVEDMETHDVFAAKIVAKASIVNPRAQAKLKSEIQIHRSLDHEKVVRFYDYFEDNDYVYIILELCPCQTLNEFMRKRPSKRLSEAEAMFYVYDLIVALKYLHRRRVIHRDLKLGNLFLDGEMRIKVGDFGLAAQLEHDGEKKKTICGTPNYIAPEILEGRHGHSFEVDVWSLGVILYTMVIGRPPFETSDVKTTYRRIRYNQYSFPDNVRVSDQAKELVQCILRTDPRSRPSLDEIIAAPWFQSGRVPPPMPVTVAAFMNASPRTAQGGSSARSETPERGVVDFARIDSPVPRFPLRDRSPSTGPPSQGTIPMQPTQLLSQPNVQQPQQLQPSQPAQVRGQSATPALQPKSVSVSNGSTTPGRYQPTGLSSRRPPFPHRGNEENVTPNGADVVVQAKLQSCSDSGVRRGNCPASPPMMHRQPLGAPSQQQLTPCASGSSLGPQHQVASASGALRAASHQPTARESSPAMGPAPSLGSNSGISVQGGVTLKASGVRANTTSPRQALVPCTNRIASGASSPKETHGHSRPNVRPISAVPSTGSNASVSKQSSARMNEPRAPVAAAPLSGGRGIHAPPDSPIKHLTSQQQQPLTPGAVDVADIVSARTPTQQCVTPQPLSDRRPPSASAARNERSSSSPALAFEGLMRCPATPTPGPDSRPESARSGWGGATGRGSCRELHSARDDVDGALATQSGSYPAEQMPELYVVKWVDYSSKYGVGYILSDGSIGVYFNDSTKIITDSAESNRFDYITRRTQERPEQRSTHIFTDYPDDLKKKVTLLRHFKNYMLTDSAAVEKKDGATVGESSLPPPSQTGHAAQRASADTSQAPYVKKWTRNHYAIMFQLTNRVVQVIFFDRTEAVLSSKSHTVTYVDKRGQVCAYPLSSSLEVPSAELAKRLKYTKEILVNLLGNRQADTGATGR